MRTPKKQNPVSKRQQLVWKMHEVSGGKKMNQLGFEEIKVEVK